MSNNCGRSPGKPLRNGRSEPDMTAPLFSVIIPTYNRPQPLAACLNALADSTLPASAYEVIVVDDGGANQIAELATTSDIVTWRLAPGDNDIRFTVGSGATEATGMKIVYRIDYVSL